MDFFDNVLGYNDHQSFDREPFLLDGLSILKSINFHLTLRHLSIFELFLQFLAAKKKMIKIIETHRIDGDKKFSNLL